MAKEQVINNTSEKANFIVGLSAAVLALHPFKETAESFSIPFFGFDFSLYTLAGIFVLLLFLSAYLYGLNHIRYTNSFFLNVHPLKHIETFAQVLFSFVFLLPIILLVLWGISSVLNILSGYWDNLHIYISQILNISGVLLGLASGLVSFFAYRNQKKKLQEEFQTYSNVTIRDQKLQVGRNHFNSMVLDLYEACIYALRAQLVDYVGVGIKNFSNSQVIGLALANNLINKIEMEALVELRVLRNEAAHAGDPEQMISRERFDRIYQQTTNLLDKLQVTKPKKNQHPWVKSVALKRKIAEASNDEN